LVPDGAIAPNSNNFETVSFDNSFERKRRTECLPAIASSTLLTDAGLFFSVIYTPAGIQTRLLIKNTKSVFRLQAYSEPVTKRRFRYFNGVDGLRLNGDG
jgi:hypothetical protein